MTDASKNRAQDPSQADAYSAAGVDFDAANRAVDRIKAISSRTLRPEVLAGVDLSVPCLHLGPIASRCSSPVRMA